MIERYVFPNSAIPRLDDLVAAASPRFVIADLHNFGLDYVRTLEAWRENFDEVWPRLDPGMAPSSTGSGITTSAASMASFRAERNHLWQFVLTPTERREVYRSVR